jgi:hypothetical protein
LWEFSGIDLGWRNLEQGGVKNMEQLMVGEILNKKILVRKTLMMGIELNEISEEKIVASRKYLEQRQVREICKSG